MTEIRKEGWLKKNNQRRYFVLHDTTLAWFQQPMVCILLSFLFFFGFVSFLFAVNQTLFSSFFLSFFRGCSSPGKSERLN
jgi:hypothetical protein